MKIPTHAALRLLFGVSLITSRAVAQEPAPGEAVDDLDLVKLLNVEVSTATKTAESLDEAPAVITVVTRSEILRWGYQSVAEVLNHTVGFYLTDDHILPNAGVRGMTGGLGAESGMIKVMIDGRSVAYRTTSGNWLGVELVPLSSIAQIEIIRGPASALYGADAFLGVVNIITVKPEDMRPFRARAAAGFVETNPGTRLDAAAGARFGDFDLLIGAAGEYTDRSGLALPSESPAPRLPAGLTDRTATNLERRSLVLQGRLGYRGDSGHLVLSAYASGLERGGDFAHWAQLTNGRDSEGRARGTVVGLGQLRANIDGLFHATDDLDLALSTTYFQGRILDSDRVEVASELYYVDRQESYRGVDTTAELRYTPSSSFNLIAGAEGVYDREDLGNPRRVDRLGNLVPETRADREPIDLVELGAYVSSNLKLFDPWLKLTGGIRYDRHNEFGEAVSGRVGVTSRWSRALVAKLLYGSAFKAPSPYLSHAIPLRLGDVIGNPNLKPQKIHTLEYQMSWKPDRFFGLSSAVSYNWLLEKAEFTPQGINQTARNVSSQRTLAWETRADVRYYRDVIGYLSFDLVHSVRDLGQQGYVARLVGTENVAYPSWILRLGTIAAVPSLSDFPLELGAEGMLVAQRRAADTSIVERGEEYSLPGYFMLDFSVATRELYLAPGHETRLALRSRNLLLARGPDPGFSGVEYPLAPAELFLEIQHTY